MVINLSRKVGRRGRGSYEEADCNTIINILIIIIISSILFSSGRVQHFLFVMMLVKTYL